jgi:UDP-N-acetylmuramoylalanine--D-glutamate ligase
MIVVDRFANQIVVVLGLGRTGLMSALSLIKGGAHVISWDDKPPKRAKAAAEGIHVQDPLTLKWDGVAAVVLSPGIPHTFPNPHPVVVKAQSAQVPIISDIDLLSFAESHARFIAITGTNGKSTTTYMIGHIIEQSQIPVQVGGNTGTAVLSLEPLGPEGIYVLELSSYQLELSHSTTHDVAILLNITPDHLERHGSMDAYVAAKKKVFNNQRPGQVAIVSIDDVRSEEIYLDLKARGQQNVIGISTQHDIKGGVYIRDNKLIDDAFGTQEVVIDFTQTHTLQKQNGQNIAAAYIACRMIGVRKHVICQALQSFKNLPHRQELISTVDNIQYINDSKATNAAAVAQALDKYENIFWILGGRPKSDGLSGLHKYYPKITKAYLIGEAQEKFAAVLEDKVQYELCEHLDIAIERARADALAASKSKPVVLFSPACESFDQFENFEHRGDSFRTLVEELPGMHMNVDQKFIEKGAYG